MSGYVPDFISKNHYIVHDGVEALVKGYSFTASDAPQVPNTDKLLIQFKKAVVPFDYRTMRPLAAADVPEWLFKGAVVAVGEDVSAVKEFWGERAKGEKTTRTLVSVEGRTPMLLSELRPASEAQVKQYDARKRDESVRQQITKAELLGLWLE